jgi:hypothetical protein
MLPPKGRLAPDFVAWHLLDAASRLKVDLQRPHPYRHKNQRDSTDRTGAGNGPGWSKQ